MQLYGQVGPQILVDGNSGAIRLGRTGDVSTSKLNPDYYEQVLRGNVYFAANQAAITFTSGLTLSAAVTSFCLSNPPTSSKNIIPLSIEWVPTTGALVGAVALSVMPYSATTMTVNTALTIRSALGGTAVSGQALASSGVTSPLAPVVWRALMAVAASSTAGAAVTGPVPYNPLGGMILTPGTAVMVLASAAITGISSCTWLEVNPTTGN